MEMEVKTESRKRVGAQLRQQREEQGWTIAQVAEMVGVKFSTVEKIEAGVFNVPLDVLAKVAEVLGCELTIKTK